MNILPGVVASQSGIGGVTVPAAPVNSALPAITGTPTDGQTLTASTGTWSGSPTFTYQWNRGGVPISGSINSTRILTSTDVGAVMSVTVSATNAGGTVTATSAGTAAVAAATLPVPVNSVAPVATGTGTVGQTLSTSTGTWSNSPTGYAYQWRRDGVNISGATSATYALVQADSGTSVTCRVSATNAGGTGVAVSNAISVAVNDIVAPTLSSPTGTQTGQTTATVGVTTNEAGGTLYFFVSNSATPPAAAALKAGTGAVTSGSQVVSATGAQSVNLVGLTAATTYYTHWLHRDAAGNDSTIVSGTGFTTAAAAAITTIPTVSSAPLAVGGVARLIPGYTGNLYMLTRSDAATRDVPQDSTGKADLTGVATWLTGFTASAKFYDQSGNGHVFTGAMSYSLSNAIRGHVPLLGGVGQTGDLNSGAYNTIPSTHSVQLRSFSVFHAVAVGGGPIDTLGLWGFGTATDGTTPGTTFAKLVNGGYQSMPGFRGAPRSMFQHYSPDVNVLTSSATWKNRVHKAANSGSQSADVTLTGGRIGSYSWSSSIAAPAAHLGWVSYGTQLSDADTLLVEDAIASIFGINLAPDTNIVFDGDSITNNNNQGVMCRGIPFLVGPNLSQYCGMMNTAVSGDFMSGINSQRSRALGRYSSSFTRNIIHVWGGTNDIAALATTTFDTRLTTANTTSGSPTAVVADATSMAVGNYVGSAQFPAGTTITGIAGTSVTCSANATATATAQTFRAMDGALAAAAASTIWTGSMLPYIRAAQAAGFTLVVGTTIQRFWASVSTTAVYGYELTRQALNALIINNAASEFYEVADYGGIAALGSGTANTPNTAYYGSDQIHPKAAGYVLMEPRATIALNNAITYPAGVLSLPVGAQYFNLGTPGSMPISGATSGSTITAIGLPSGVTVNSAARTLDYDGTGSLGTSSISLIETPAGGKAKRSIVQLAVVAAGVFAQADFTGAAGTSILTYIPEAGPKFIVGSGSAPVSASLLDGSGALYSPGAPANYVIPIMPPSADHTVIGLLPKLTVLTGEGQGIISRHAVAAQTYITTRWSETAGAWATFTITAGSSVQIGSNYTDAGYAAAVNREVKHILVGSTVNTYLDGVLVPALSGTTTLTTNGYCGVRSTAINAAGTGVHFSSLQAKV